MVPPNRINLVNVYRNMQSGRSWLVHFSYHKYCHIEWFCLTYSDPPNKFQLRWHRKRRWGPTQDWSRTLRTCVQKISFHRNENTKWLVLHVLEGIGDPPDGDDVGELALLGLLTPMDVHTTNGGDHQQAEQEKGKGHFGAWVKHIVWLDKRWEATDVKGLVIICTLHTIYICHCKQKQVTKVLCFWHLFQTNNRYISCSPENSQLKLSFILSHFTITITAHHYTLETKAHSPKVLLGRVRWGTLRRRSWNRPAACRPASAKDSGVDLLQLGKIADISHNRHIQQWCSFFKPV